jgi:hypothetical protein
MVNGRPTKPNSWIDSFDATIREVGYSDSLISDIAKDFALTCLLWEIPTEDIPKVFGLLYYASSGEPIPEELWDDSYKEAQKIEARKWAPWRSGLFGLGSICRVAGSTEEGKCVGIRSGRVAVDFGSTTIVLNPAVVEGKVE